MQIRHATALCVSLLLCNACWGYALDRGASREDVLSAYGPPASHAKAGEREILNYGEGSVVLNGGRVTELCFSNGEPRIVKQSPVAQVSLPRPPSTQISPVNVRSIPKAKPRLAQPTSPPPIPAVTGFRVWTYATAALALFFVGAVALKGKARRYYSKSRRTEPRHFVVDGPIVVPGTAQDVVTRHNVPLHGSGRQERQRGSTQDEIIHLNRQSLDRLEWRRFEELIHGYFETQGWKPQRSRVGADGGIDILLYRPGEQKPSACVQCKAWRTYTVGVKPVRELLGVMAANEIPEGYFVATGGYTSEATSFAAGNKLHLLTGDDVISRFKALADSDHVRVVSHAFRGDFETPTCPSCDEKMILRQAEQPFWGCRNFPRCRHTFKVRDEH